jgi:N6-L-threonylcarbamoyladenine synthase
VILALETSCDDTCAAVVSDDGEVRSNAIASQGLLHARYGGVVPEVASRRHLELVDAVVADALEGAGASLDELGSMAVTRGPGLIGALLVGVSWAKALAAARELPLVAVDHLHGHVVASTLSPDPIEAPYLCLVASGGHTFLARVEDPREYTVLGRTLDDAAGEAFDKGARILGLPYPGGPALDKLAREGDPESFAFPRAAPGDGLDFSFSGVKTALLYTVRDLGEEEVLQRRADLAASYQRAIVTSLVDRLTEAMEREDPDAVALGGGVAANSELRASARELCERLGVALHVPPPELCTDNAAMIAAAARFCEPLPYPDYLTLDAEARTGLKHVSSARPRRPSVTLYGKPGCCLCDDARVEIERLRSELGFELAEVDVSLDPRLHRRYGERIPVVEVDGEEACDLGVDVAALRDLLGRVDA